MEIILRIDVRAGFKTVQAQTFLTDKNKQRTAADEKNEQIKLEID